MERVQDEVGDVRCEDAIERQPGQDVGKSADVVAKAVAVHQVLEIEEVAGRDPLIESARRRIVPVRSQQPEGDRKGQPAERRPRGVRGRQSR
jgi:hypothetical protein